LLENVETTHYTHTHTVVIFEKMLLNENSANIPMSMRITQCDIEKRVQSADGSEEIIGRSSSDVRLAATGCRIELKE